MFAARVRLRNTRAYDRRRREANFQNQPCRVINVTPTDAPKPVVLSAAIPIVRNPVASVDDSIEGVSHPVCCTRSSVSR